LFFYMRRVGLSTLLIGLNAGLVLLAVVGVAFAAVELLQRLAHEQALERVHLAGASAHEAVERSARDVLTAAQLLGERPTVGRLVGARDAEGLAGFLDRFQRTSRLSGAAILADGRVLAAGGAPVPWREVLGRAGEDGGSTLLRTRRGSLLLVASAPVTAAPGAVAVTALNLDARFAREITAQVGLPVSLLAAEEARERPEGPRMALRAEALAASEPAAGRLAGSGGAAGSYVAVLPLSTPAGEAAALVETSLPTAGVSGSLARVVRTLLLLALLVAALATLSGFLISRRLTRPVEALTSAAERIGRGDLSTPTPRAPGAELGTLAATMDEMRRRLLRLTSELRLRQAEGEAILTGISEGVFSVDRDRRIRYLNPQAAALLGVRPEDAIGRFCGDVLNARDRDGSRPCHQDCPIVHARFRGGASAAETLVLPDGTRRAVVIASSPSAEDRQFQVMRDETDVEAARRLRDAVLANISHEFKTPLSAQLASIELLRDRLIQGSDPESAGLVLSLERGSLRLTQLIDNLLESVRIESGQDSIRLRPVALDEVVEDAVEMTAPLLAQRGQTVEIDLPYPLPPVEGDAPRLTQVFVNLLANANKYAPAGSAVRLGGAVEEGRVLLWVADQGPGLPEGPEDSGRSLFARFVRAPEEGEEPEQTGMGLGLWIVQSIVERHGGTVEARRERGVTRMVVALPRKALEAAARRASA
jgi:signal transduction histidine kinase